MSGFCINCEFHSVEKENIFRYIPDSPINLRSKIFFDLSKNDIKRKSKEGILCCKHEKHITTDYTTGNYYYQPCSVFNTEGQCPFYHNPDEDIPDDELPIDPVDTPEDSQPEVPDSNSNEENLDNSDSQESSVND